MLVRDPAFSKEGPNSGVVETVEETSLEVSGGSVGDGTVDGVLDSKGGKFRDHIVPVGFQIIYYYILDESFLGH